MIIKEKEKKIAPKVHITNTNKTKVDFLQITK